MSNYYPVNKSYGDKKDCHDGGDHQEHSDKGCKPEKIISKCKEICGSIKSVKFPSDDPITTDEFTIATIVVKDLCCFKKPCVRIDTSSVITGTTSDGEDLVSITFRIYKRCDNENNFKEIKSITTPKIEVEDDGYSVISPIPSICDCEESCRKECCCEYKITAQATIEAECGDEITLNISEGIISVIANEGNC